MSNQKKKPLGKTVIMVVAVILAVTTVTLSATCLPDLITRINNNQKQEIVSKIYNAYVSGDYDSAKAYAAEIADYIKKDGNLVAEDYVKLIELRESMDGWSGTSDELYEIIKEFYNSLNGNFVKSYEMPCLDLPIENGEISENFFKKMDAEYEVLPELNQIMKEFFENYYQKIHLIYDIYNRSYFFLSEALNIDSAISETFDSAINSIDTLKNAAPDYAMLDFASDIIINAKETYEDTIRGYLIRDDFRNGMMALTTDEQNNIKYKIEQLILLEKSYVSSAYSLISYFEFGETYNYYDCDIQVLKKSEIADEEQINEYKSFSKTAYITISLASDLFANLKINIDSSREIKSIAEISKEAFGRYWSNLC